MREDCARLLFEDWFGNVYDALYWMTVLDPNVQRSVDDDFKSGLAGNSSNIVRGMLKPPSFRQPVIGRVGRFHRKHKDSAGLEHALYFAKHLSQISNINQHVGRNDQIEAIGRGLHEVQ